MPQHTGGSLEVWYLVHTRPDLAFLVGYVSRFMECHTVEHMDAMKRLLRYTIDYGPSHPRGSQEAKLVGYSDSDHTGYVDTRKSADRLISWQSAKQRVVAASCCEAEFVAAATVATQAIWLARLLGDLKGQEADTEHVRTGTQQEPRFPRAEQAYRRPVSFYPRMRGDWEHLY